MTRIAEYLEGYTFDQFKKDSMTVDAVTRNFEVIGEASRKLPDRIKKIIQTFLGMRCICSEIR